MTEQRKAASRDRPRRVRELARELSTRTGATVRATYDTGARWLLEWTDGPSRPTVRAAVEAADLAGAEVQLYRSLSARALALGALRAAAAGELAPGRRWSGQPHWQIERLLEDVDHPERTVDAREEQMVARLLAAATPPGRDHPDKYTVCDLVADRGLAWLLTADEQPAEGSTAAPAVQLTPLEQLTSRYATGRDRDAWQDQTHTLPVRAAVDAALADPDLDADTAHAILAVLPELRAELERTEARVVTAARRAGLTWKQVGAALGISAQDAVATWPSGTGSAPDTPGRPGESAAAAPNVGGARQA